MFQGGSKLPQPPTVHPFRDVVAVAGGVHVATAAGQVRLVPGPEGGESRRTGPTGINYRGIFSGNLLNWVDGTPVSITPLADGWEQVIVDDPNPAGLQPDPSRFATVQITSP